MFLGLNKSDPEGGGGGRTLKLFSLLCVVEDVNISLLRRFRGFSFIGGGVFSSDCVAGGTGFSRPAGFLRVVRFIVVVVLFLLLVLLILLGMERL
jgi:hypothetical protein